MAFPVDLAQEWMMELMNTQQLLDLSPLVWRAYAWRHSIPADQQPVWEALNGFTIYVGLLSRVTSTRWKQKFDMVSSVLRSRRNPLIYFWMDG